MGIVISLILIAAGAVLRFAITADATGIDLHTAGVILMIVGGIGLILSLIFWASWGAPRRRTEVTETAVRGPETDYPPTRAMP